MKKADYTICSVPDHIELSCPNCNEELVYNYEKLERSIGSDLYYGNSGIVDCSGCGTQIELGECEYD